MNVYLNNYRRFLFSCKGIVSISDTQKYISNNEFDINEIITFLEECIDINDIINLVNSENFYKEHSLKEKYSLLIQFFNVIHNYSKNLILKYDVYSTKSIKKTTANIKDCLVHIPNYKNYMLDLLGYNYNKDKSEWYIDINSEKAFSINVVFAATCILCGYAHQKLMKIMEETNFSEYEDGIECRHTTLLNKENNWICKSCSFSNDFKSINCESCFIAREKKRAMNILKANQWECSDCTFINETNNNFCNICNSGRKLSKAISISSVNLTRSKDEQKAVLSENLSRNITIDRNKYEQIKRQISLEKNLINRQSSNRWECTRCTFLNKKENLNCEVCSMKLDVGTNTKPRNYSRATQIYKDKNAVNTIKRSYSEHALIKGQLYKPDYTESTPNKQINKRINRKPIFYSNNNNGNVPRDEANKIRRSLSEHTLIKRRSYKLAYTESTQNKQIKKRINEKPIFYSNNNNGNVPRDAAKEIRRSSSEHSLIKGHPDEWACTKCTFHNKNENLNCGVCSMERDVTNRKPIFSSLNNNEKKNNIRRSSSEYISTNQQSHQFDSSKRNFINIKGNLNSKDYSKKPDDKINEFQHSISQNVPHTSDANKNQIITPNKRNSSHQPSHKQDPNADKTYLIPRNIPRNNESTLIPSSVTNNAPKSKECKVCRKIIKNKTHKLCKFKAMFFCMNTY